ncbi:MAG: hypothetical protein BA867_14520 [Desulfobacterales bacterium S5133MH16]|nr:MAG: hypothetical protein BA867_14520 [Desulfobacterales bacterium S5133MH16]
MKSYRFENVIFQSILLLHFFICKDAQFFVHYKILNFTYQKIYLNFLGRDSNSESALNDGIVQFKNSGNFFLYFSVIYNIY